MPLEIIDSADPITRMIRFKTSAVYEMIISLQLFLEPTRRHREWIRAVAADLPNDFIEEMAALYRPFRRGYVFFELAVDYANHDDVVGFVEYVRHMPAAQFMFYVVGRVIPLPLLEAEPELTPDVIIRLLKEANNDYASYCLDLPYDLMLADLADFQNRLADMWQFYWEAAFSKQIATFSPFWENAIADRERYLAREGGARLLEALLGRFHQLPPSLPADMPVDEVLVIPLYLLPSRAFMFYGYGNVTVLFDSRLTEARVAEIEQGRDQALAMLRALSDSSRLSILQVIARSHGKVHGQKIAKMLDLSPSVVSRHLTQLKESGLIVEEPQENRILHYRLQEEAITALPEKLLDYIYS